MMTVNELNEGLRNFSGSETFTRHGLLRQFVMTQGVVWLAENAGAHWLTDVIVSHQIDPKVKAEEFQVWKLTMMQDPVSLNGVTFAAKVEMTDGNDGAPIICQMVEYTDFPLPEITIWLTGGTLMLPGEY